MACAPDAPQPGDTALVLDVGATGTATDDRWRAWLVLDAGVRSGGCTAPPLATLVAPGAHRLTLTGAAPLPDSMPAGMPVRVLRARRWSLYRAADLHWYLGMRERGVAGWGPLQPVSGPYDRHRPPADGGSGLAIALEPAAGAPVVTVALRASRRTTSGGATGRRVARTDSLRLHVAPRNGAVPAGG